MPCDELRTWSPDAYAARVRERVGDGPAFLSFDIDAIDPAFAPATGTPEVCGLLPHEAIAFLRVAARACAFTGFDLVEVAPAYDTNAQITALLAANIAYEMLTLSSTESWVTRDLRRAPVALDVADDEQAQRHARPVVEVRVPGRVVGSAERSMIAASGPIGKRAHQAASNPRASAASICGSQAWT